MFGTESGITGELVDHVYGSLEDGVEGCVRERKGNGIRLKDKHSSLKMRVYVIRENMLAWPPINNRNKYNSHILHVKMAIESK